MTTPDVPTLPDGRLHQLTRLLQAGIAVLALYGLATGQLGIAVNGTVTLAVTLLPAVLRREAGVTFSPGLVLWLTVAVVLHSIGALGPYRSVPLYDELAHAVSASLVAGIGYAMLRALEAHSDELHVTGPVRSVFLVLFVLAAGVAWEILEFGTTLAAEALDQPSVLTVYGIDDIVTDMVFNALGGIVVALLAGDGSLRDLIATLRRLLTTVDGE